MRGKPLYGYAAIAVVGLALMVVLSFLGVDQKEARVALEEEGGQPPQTAVSGPASLGEGIYKQSCIGCHGANFESPMANLKGLADRYSKDEVIQIIVEGIPGTTMPGGLVKDAGDVEALTDYLLESAK